jgi:hypothetical protein
VSKLLKGAQATLAEDKAINLDNWLASIGRQTECGHTFFDLAEHLAEALEAERSKTTDVFVASPMSTNIKGAYEKNKQLTMSLVTSLRSQGLRTYFAGEDIHKQAVFDDPALAYEANMRHIVESKAFVLYLPPKRVGDIDPGAPVDAPSSVWIELGIALARGMPCTLLAPEVDSLPFVVRRALKDKVRPGKELLDARPYGRSPRAPMRLIEKHGKGWLVGGSRL